MLGRQSPAVEVYVIGVYQDRLTMVGTHHCAGKKIWHLLRWHMLDTQLNETGGVLEPLIWPVPLLRGGVALGLRLRRCSLCTCSWHVGMFQ